MNWPFFSTIIPARRRGESGFSPVFLLLRRHGPNGYYPAVMSLLFIPARLRQKFQIEERVHACAVLKSDFPDEWKDILDCLDAFTLKRSEVIAKGGNKTEIAKGIDQFLNSRGWEEKQFDTRVVVDGVAKDAPTHKIDNFKNRVGVEVEWNNKDPFFDRDLNNFRLLHQLDVLSAGVIITRMWELQKEFREAGKGQFLRDEHHTLRQAAPQGQRRRGRWLPAPFDRDGVCVLRSKRLACPL